jgi:hypothetical protein
VITKENSIIEIQTDTSTTPFEKIKEAFETTKGLIVQNN